MTIMLVSALLPALLLMRWIYRRDTAEKEPKELLIKLVLRGALCCIPAALLESIFEKVADNFGPAGSPSNTFVLTFGVIALAEEGCKYLTLRRFTWNNPNFNYRFDGIVYAVFVSLGFAALENVLYVAQYGGSVILARALLSIPGHCTFGIFMGLFYSNSKHADLYNNGVGHRRNQWLALLVPVALHGFYDYCCMRESLLASGIFLLFVIALDIFAVALVKRQSKQDRPL